jgi:sterol desaturase/sphingolipid hydroxylase (fatty acid hydroxylase superfamily)
MHLPIIQFGWTVLLPVFLGLIVLEYRHARHLYIPNESLASFAIALGATTITTFSKAYEMAFYFLLYQWAEPVRTYLIGTGVWVLCLIGDDFNFYWFHRISHNVRVLWAAHLPHHSARTFNLTVSVRNGCFVAFYKPIFWFWMPLLGFEPAMIATCLIINAYYQFFLHSQLVPALPLLSKVFNTPYLHQIHHSRNPEYLDKNHAGILIVWDRLFGTFQERLPDVPPLYGITYDIGSDNPVTHHLSEFQAILRDVRRATNWKDRLRYVVGPPGWSHDGRTQTSRQLQAAFRGNAR